MESWYGPRVGIDNSITNSIKMWLIEISKMNSARPLNLVRVLLILVSPPGKVYWPLLKLSPFGFSRDTVNFTRDATNLSGSLTKFSDPAINFDNLDRKSVV